MFRQGFTAVWWQARWARYAFVAGLLIGLLLGWFFHAVISLFLRLGIALVLLLPLVVIAYLLWRRGSNWSSGPGTSRGSAEIVTWNADWRPGDMPGTFVNDQQPDDSRRGRDE